MQISMASLVKILCTARGVAIYRNRGRVNENVRLKHNFYCSRVCDSASEALIDNWLTEHRIEHERDALYPATHHKADWKIGSSFVEYFGLAEDSPRYDRAVRRKKNLCRKHRIPLVEIYPKDIYPNIILEDKLGSLAGKF